MKYQFPLQQNGTSGDRTFPTGLAACPDQFRFLDLNQIAVVGGGPYGIATATLMAKNLIRFREEVLKETCTGHIKVLLNSHKQDPVAHEAALEILKNFNEDRKSPVVGGNIHPALEGTHDLADALRGRRHIYLALNSSNYNFVEELADTVAKLRQAGDLPQALAFVVVTKGLQDEEQTKLALQCPSDVLETALARKMALRPEDSILVAHGAAFAEYLLNDSSYSLTVANRRSELNQVPIAEVTALLSRRNGPVHEIAGAKHTVEIGAIGKNVVALFRSYIKALCKKYQIQEDAVIIERGTIKLSNEIQRIHIASMSEHRDASLHCVEDLRPQQEDLGMTCASESSRNNRFGKAVVNAMTIEDAYEIMRQERPGQSTTVEGIDGAHGLASFVQNRHAAGVPIENSKFELLNLFAIALALRDKRHEVNMTIRPTEYDLSARAIQIEYVERALLDLIEISGNSSYLSVGAGNPFTK
jgi:glycerol-3-phosphate dehydrogenase